MYMSLLTKNKRVFLYQLMIDKTWLFQGQNILNLSQEKNYFFTQ